MKNKIYNKFSMGVIAVCMVTLTFISCFDNGFEEFIPPSGNVNGIQPNTLFTTTTSATNSLTMVFRSFSTDAVSHAWDFGDGNVSTEANPTHTYAEGGLYFVQLITTASDGLTAVANTNVSPVFIDFNLTTEDTEVTFENLTTGANELTWDFGDGDTVEWNVTDNTIEDPNFSPIHIYRSNDVFEATLTVTNFLGDQFELTRQVTGLVLSTVPDFTFSTSDLTVEFTDNSLFAVSHMWDFGDGNTSTEVNPTHTYATSGSFDVTLTTTNEAGVSRSVTIAVPVGGIEATFAAVLQNADFQSFPTAEMNNNDLVDAWTVDPDNTFNDGSPTPFDFWRNDDLESWVSDPANNGGSGTTDKGSSSGTDATSAGGTSDRSIKFDSSGERAYQPFEVETGVEYTISVFIRTESTPVGDLEGTFYILSDEPAADTELSSLALVTEPVISDAVDGWQQVSFSFTADATFNFPQSRVDENTDDILNSVDQDFVIFYFVPTTTVTSENEVFVTDIVLSTPGF